MISKIISIDNANILPDDKTALATLCNFFVEYDSDPVSDEDILSRISDAEIIIVNKCRLNSQIIENLRTTSLICVFGSGFEFIDIAAANRKGITVTNIPDYCTQAVAEHTVALMIAASRFYYKAGSELRSGIWNPHRYKGLELYGKTLGIIGYGRVGRRVSKIARGGFGMNVIAVNSKSTRNEIETLLKEADFISIHVPLNKATRNLISQKEFDLMKDGVVIVNTSRGAVIDTDALVKNIKDKRVFAAGLDVFEREPILLNHPLLRFDNVILTPHMGFKTSSSEELVSRLLVENIKSFISGKTLNIVNHEK